MKVEGGGKVGVSYLLPQKIGRAPKSMAPKSRTLRAQRIWGRERDRSKQIYISQGGSPSIPAASGRFGLPTPTYLFTRGPVCHHGRLHSCRLSLPGSSKGSHADQKPGYSYACIPQQSLSFQSISHTFSPALPPKTQLLRAVAGSERSASVGNSVR